MKLIDLCRDLFLLAQHEFGVEGAARGLRWEQRIAEHLARRGAPVEALPGGYRVFGHASLSGLAHQVDGAIACQDAMVIGEWKAHRDSVPKNELLRFKAATDDYFTALTWRGTRRPIIRVFGGAGRVSHELRAYAAIHGIAVIDRDRWPAPVLAAAASWRWPAGPMPSESDRCHLAWLARPVQTVLIPHQDGSLRIPPPPSCAAVKAALALQDEWSDRLFEAFDEAPGQLEHLLARVATAA
jgi:hypothetical protein